MQCRSSMVLLLLRRPVAGLLWGNSQCRLDATTSTVRTGRCWLHATPKQQQAVEISPNTHGTKPLQTLVASNPQVYDNLRRLGWIKPTPIQAHVLPLIDRGDDIMASAATGSGKTLMFGWNVANLSVSQTQSKSSPQVLILNPTRELAMQTRSVLEDLLQGTPHQIALATGGDNVSKQRTALSQSNVVVGTPGRVLQFVDERQLSLKQLQYVVVDEADRMLDLGFEEQLRRLLKQLPRSRQTVLCSATFPADVQRLATDFMKSDYYFCAAGRVGGMKRQIEQELVYVQDNHNEIHQSVRHHIQRYLPQLSRVIVFCNTKEACESLGRDLKQLAPTRVVTGDKLQSERNRSIAEFRSGKVVILVATDVAARGLDVPNVGLVVQADAPRDVDTFVHRIGRTGRAGNQGRAISLLSGKNMNIAGDLVELLHEADQSIPAWLRGMAHVVQSRKLEEESTILAGGGGSGSSKATVTTTTNEKYSGQDFRREAADGSWGSDRDTSYASFDKDAYSSFESSNVTYIEDTTFESSMSDDLGEIRSNEGAEDPTPAPPFVRSRPSERLQRVLKDTTNSSNVSDKPNRKVLDALSKLDQQLRFEYLGMFPFEDVFEMLQQRKQQHNGSNDLPKVLLVAEKPSIAQAIADALSGPRGPRQRRGISRALPVYTFVARFHGQKVQCIVTSVVGHIFSLRFDECKPGLSNEGKREYMDPEDYFDIPVVKQEESSTGKLRVVDHLRALAGESDHLVLFLDCDAEGENIAFEVIGVTRGAFEQKIAKERAENPEGPLTRRVHRAKFSAITREALSDAFHNLSEPDAALSRSVDARQELDLRVGVAMTRLLTWRCIHLARQKFSPATRTISYGPCQTPTLSFVVDRAREIERFRAEPYWRLHLDATFPGSKSPAVVRWKSTHPVEATLRRTSGKRKDDTRVEYEESATFDQVEVDRLVRLASHAKSTLRIKSVTETLERINPPLGLNTVALLSAGSKTMGMSPKQVMHVAEKLYSAGFISYPRTETTKYDPKGFDTRALLCEHASHPEWGKTAKYLLSTKYAKRNTPPQRGVDKGDHPPITVLKSATREEVGGGAAWRVYEFVARNFIGSLSNELTFTRRVATLELESDVDGGSERSQFEMEQVKVDNLGFAGSCRWVLRDIGASKPEDVENVLREGMTLDIRRARTEVCQTRPPPFLQEHELIELMDENSVGTDASMATHVSNIVDREYVVLCDETGVPLRPPRPPRPGQQRPPRQVGRYLVPTPLGTAFMRIFGDPSLNLPEQQQNVNLISRPKIRSQMEAECRGIATGQVEKDKCLEHNLSWFRDRYRELAGTLSPAFLNSFRNGLKPTKQGLQEWRRLGAFEAPAKAAQNDHKARDKNKTRNGKRYGEARRSNDRHHRHKRARGMASTPIK